MSRVPIRIQMHKPGADGWLAMGLAEARELDWESFWKLAPKRLKRWPFDTLLTAGRLLVLINNDAYQRVDATLAGKKKGKPSDAQLQRWLAQLQGWMEQAGEALPATFFWVRSGRARKAEPDAALAAAFLDVVRELEPRSPNGRHINQRDVIGDWPAKRLRELLSDLEPDLRAEAEELLPSL